MQKTWFITGAARGFGLEIAKAALRAGDRVVAAARSPAAATRGLGPDSEQLLAVELDVTRADQAHSATAAAVARFGTIDVLVNNAGYGHLGFFEEATAQDVEAQFATNVLGLLSVTRAVLPVMRAARQGRIFNLSSMAGLRGTEFASLYCTSKFAVEGFSESLAQELAPFGIFVTLVEPGPFRTDFLAPQSIRYGGGTITDYDERRARLRVSFEQRNGQQPGNPVKLAMAIVQLAREPKPPMRFVAGAMAVQVFDAKLAAMRAELDAWRALSLDTDYSAPATPVR